MASHRKIFLCDGMSPEELSCFTKKIKALKATATSFKKSLRKITHLVCKNLVCNDKFYAACAQGAWIVIPQFVEDSFSVGQWLCERDYVHSVADGHQSPELVSAAKRWLWKWEMFQERPFSGWSAAVLMEGEPGVRCKWLLSVGGAKVVSLALPLADNQDVSDLTYVVVDNAHRSSAAHLQEFGLICVKPDFITDTIVKDEELEPFDYLITAAQDTETEAGTDDLQSRGLADTDLFSQASTESPLEPQTDVASASSSQSRSGEEEMESGIATTSRNGICSRISLVSRLAEEGINEIRYAEKQVESEEVSKLSVKSLLSNREPLSVSDITSEHETTENAFQYQGSTQPKYQIQPINPNRPVTVQQIEARGGLGSQMDRKRELESEDIPESLVMKKMKLYPGESSRDLPIDQDQRVQTSGIMEHSTVRHKSSKKGIKKTFRPPYMSATSVLPKSVYLHNCVQDKANNHSRIGSDTAVSPLKRLNSCNKLLNGERHTSSDQTSCTVSSVSASHSPEARAKHSSLEADLDLCEDSAKAAAVITPEKAFPVDVFSTPQRPTQSSKEYIKSPLLSLKLGPNIYLSKESFNDSAASPNSLSQAGSRSPSKRESISSSWPQVREKREDWNGSQDAATQPSPHQTPPSARKSVQASLQTFGFSSSFSKGDRSASKKLLNPTKPSSSSSNFFTPKKKGDRSASKKLLNPTKPSSSSSNFFTPKKKGDGSTSKKLLNPTKPSSSTSSSPASERNLAKQVESLTQARNIRVKQEPETDADYSKSLVAQLQFSSNSSENPIEISSSDDEESVAGFSVSNSPKQPSKTVPILLHSARELFKNGLSDQDNKSPKSDTRHTSLYEDSAEDGINLQVHDSVRPFTEKFMSIYIGGSEQLQAIDKASTKTEDKNVEETDISVTPRYKLGDSKARLPRSDNTTLSLQSDLTVHDSIESCSERFVSKDPLSGKESKMEVDAFAGGNKETEKEMETSVQQTKMISSLPKLYGQWMEAAHELGLNDAAVSHGRSTQLQLPTPLLLTQLVAIAGKENFTEEDVGGQACTYLHDWLRLHPPCSAHVTAIYATALRLDASCHDSNFLLDLIKKCSLEGEHSTNQMLLSFFVSLLKLNFDSCLQSEEKKVLQRCLIVRWLWANHFAVFHASRTCQLVKLLERVLHSNLSSTCAQPNLSVCESVISLISLAAECIRLASNNWDKTIGIFSSDAVIAIATDIGRTLWSCMPNCSSETVILLLEFIKPPWLQALVTATIMASFSFFLLSDAIQVKRLSLHSIVSQYFFLVPNKSNNISSQSKNSEDRYCRSEKKLDLNSEGKGHQADEHAICKKKLSSRLAKRNCKGETLMHTVCIKNDTAQLKELLLLPDADVNVKDNNKWTPLHEACYHGSLGCVELLLQYVPQPSDQQWLYQQPGTEVNGAAGDREAERAIDDRSSENGNKLGVYAPVLRKADINAKGPQGITPLHEAVMSNQAAVCQLLLQHGGRRLLKAKTELGYTPMDLAVKPEIRKVLENYLGLFNDHLNSQMCSAVIGRNGYLSEDSLLLADDEEQAPLSSLYAVLLKDKSRCVSRWDFSLFLSLLTKLFTAYCEAKGLTQGDVSVHHRERMSIESFHSALSETADRDEMVLKELPLYFRLLERHMKKVVTPTDFTALWPQLKLMETICSSYSHPSS